MPGFVHETTLTFSYDSTPTARTVERAIRREVDEIAGDRTRVAVERSGPELTVTVEATDHTAMRAGLNTWLSLVDVAEASVRIGRSCRRS